AHFDANPSAESYSLGINDGGANTWCRCEDCLAAYSGETNFIGTEDYSDPYYAWCGEVIDGVLAAHPDAWFGCLAYNNVIDPPASGRVHDRLIPYITIDRMQWADAQRRDRGRAFNERWEAAADTLGWYDYIYGRQYQLPRVYFHQMAENLRYGRDHGVRAFYAEAYPNWGEGPKLYVTTKLLWNPDADVDALLDDWYRAFAGEAAADDVARYFAHWEDFWTRRILEADWFVESQYLPFYSQAYMAEVSLEEMAGCRGWLESALAKTETDSQRARVAGLIEAFDGYESAFLHYLLNTADDPAEELASFLDGAGNSRIAGRAEALLGILSGETTPVTRNPSFETADGEGKPHNWTLWVKPLGDPPYGTMERVQGDARTGEYYIAIEGLKRGGPVQAMVLEPGRYVMVAGYRLHQVLERNRLELSITLKAEGGADLSFGAHSQTVNVDMLPGPWRVATRSFGVPDAVGGTPVAAVQFAAVVEHMTPGQRLDLDDIAIYRMPD
ncbi:MAG: DUF4838 domain-containing protein, partial [Armatimonadia bacterium]|nr:DUF4838 domain-containing protein [Armatimonadia bacterium]